MSTGSKIRILILLLLFAFGVFFVSRQMGGPAPALVAQDSTLVIEMGGGYVEGPAASPIARLVGDSSQSFLSLLSMFSLAERDARLGTVVLRIRALEIGWGKADELRAAIGRLREKGIHTVAHLEIQNFSANKELYIGSAADELFVAPGAAVPLVGLAAEYLFLGGLMEKIGVEFDVAKAGRYKSAVEAYSARGMSEASREMANSLLDDAYARFVSGLATGRNLTPQDVRDAIDKGAVRNQRLEALGLIDGEAHLDELIDRYGEDVVQHTEYAGTDPKTLGFNAQKEFALIYGSGTVVQGESGNSPLDSGPSFASDTVSRAILDAAEDDSIAAIILRIDSPGGSALASELIWRAIMRAREMGKPVIASFSDVAASGGYYVAAAADSIVSDPGTLTGSIGVFALRPTVGGLLSKMEIGIDSLTRGKHAEFLLSSEKMSPASLARLQTSVLDTYQLFLSRVSTGRGLTTEQVDEVGQGRVWTGQQALERGLVDELGGIYTAVRHAKEKVGLTADDDVFLIPFPKQKTFSEQVFSVLQSTRAQAADPLRLLPEPMAKIAGLLTALPTGTPLLIPPMLVEIR